MGNVVERTLRLLRSMDTHGDANKDAVVNRGSIQALIDLFNTSDFGAASSSVRVRAGCMCPKCMCCCLCWPHAPTPMVM
jgi:hypothetical protein